MQNETNPFGVASLILVAALSAPVLAQGKYTSLGIDVMPDAISHDGSIVCGTILNTGTSTPGSAVFTWTAATGFTQLYMFPVGSSLRYAQAAMSADGGVIARDLDAYGSGVAHRWTAATNWLSLGALYTAAPCTTSDVRGISADGSFVVGDSSNSCSPRAFRWDAFNGMVELSVTGRNAGGSSVSGDGQIVGGWDREPIRGKQIACVWYPDSRGQVMILPGTLLNPEGLGEVTHINSDGSAMCGNDYGRGSAVFRWTSAGGAVVLDAGSPRGMTEDGSMIVGVGYPDPSGSGTVPFMWTEGTGTVPLEQYLATQGVQLPTGDPITLVRGMTPDGRFIIGQRGSSLPREGFVIELPDGIKYGVGAAPANTLDLQGGGTSVIGQTFTATTSNLTGPFTATIISTGQSAPLPFAGGAFVVNLAGPLIVATLGSSGGVAALNIPIPNRPAFVGATMFMQSFAPDVVLPGGLAFSNGLRMTIRN